MAEDRVSLTQCPGLGLIAHKTLTQQAGQCRNREQGSFGLQLDGLGKRGLYLVAWGCARCPLWGKGLCGLNLPLMPKEGHLGF